MALDLALQQNPSDLTVRAELHFSKGNQLREMNQLDEAFEVMSIPSVFFSNLSFPCFFPMFPCCFGVNLYPMVKMKCAFFKFKFLHFRTQYSHHKHFCSDFVSLPKLLKFKKRCFSSSPLLADTTFAAAHSVEVRHSIT